MKTGLILAAFSLGFQSLGQVFHVSDTSALIVKTTNQSPAHWYVEVFSDSSVDTVLRWKATHFDNVPPEWEIGMDDQTASYSNIQVGDSADFNLPANQPFAKKLIIGAILNGTPGHGICYFDVYDPNNLSFVQTISYEFIITSPVNGMMELNEDSFLEFEGGYLKVKNRQEARFELYDLSGNLLLENKLTNTFDVCFLPGGQLYLIKVRLNSKEAIVKIYK
ncbi:MAG: hypothetical protein K0S23_2415 [Fluviicola sp.]|jgi:hypothetical protein|uniref:hypothetical protein n=1 Tax=Fluviicola sp. TaxID=1917219 RepID=UPI0026092851|nr:hypothetical protein [Fluviicola sp.]MDF3028108.1 hypothetical protein [Fluviicola sp.]